ncbi:MAG: alcohol dehydrogenase catalytic domain-containing protein [Patulibacter sp.]|nr:alcohol dehydrogenase catalytic domain-containing protein [Patulibacter sp.]
MDPVRVEACGLSPVDWKVAAGGHDGVAWPHVPGCDFAGALDAVGTDVPRTLLGRRVAGHGDLLIDGAMAEYGLADPLAVVLVPDGVDP